MRFLCSSSFCRISRSSSPPPKKDLTVGLIMATVTTYPTSPTRPTRTGTDRSTPPPTRARRRPRRCAAYGGATPTTRRRSGWTVLHEALAAGDRDVVRLVVDELNAKFSRRTRSRPRASPPRCSRRASLLCTSRGSSSPGCPLSGGSSRATRSRSPSSGNVRLRQYCVHLGDQAPHPRSSHLFTASLSKLFSSHSATQGGFLKLFIIINESVILLVN